MKFLIAILLLCVAVGSIQSHRQIPEECPKICPADYKPICARNKETKEFQTFGNKCALIAERCYPDGGKIIFSK